MNKSFLIGNLTKDPESRTTQNGVSLCNFTIAVNRRMGASAGQPEAEFVRVTAWRQLGEICLRYLSKGKKVAVVGSMTASAYIDNDGKARANLLLTADDVEFLSPRSDAEADAQETEYTRQEREAIQKENALPGGFVEVDENELPF